MLRGWRRDRGGRGGASNITFISHCCSESAGCCQVEASPETDQVVPGVGGGGRPLFCFVLETHGGFSPEALSFVKHLQRYALIFPPSIPDRELVTSLLTKTISVCLQRGNALALAEGCAILDRTTRHKSIPPWPQPSLFEAGRTKVKLHARRGARECPLISDIWTLWGCRFPAAVPVMSLWLWILWA